MKVLFVQNIEGIAGSEKYFWHLLPALKKRGIEVAFLCVYKSEFLNISQEFCNYLEAENIPVHRLETKSYLSFKLIRNIKSLIIREQFDLLHSHLIYADFWSAVLKTFFKLKIKTVSTLHGYQEDVYTAHCLNPAQVPKNKYYRVARFAYKRIDHVYSCSHGLKDFFYKAGIDFKHPVGVVHHGFDYSSVEVSERNALTFKCVIAGRLIPRKGHDFVLRNLKLLDQKIPGFELEIVGDGPLMSSLKKTVESSGLIPSVKFTGAVSDVRPYMAKADLVLVPSFAEGLPLVIFEAMSVGKPVIAFETIGPSEAVVNNETGVLAKAFDDKEFAGAIIDLAGKPAELLRMGVNAKKLVQEKFSLHSMTENTIRFYEMCLK